MWLARPNKKASIANAPKSCLAWADFFARQLPHNETAVLDHW